MGSVCCVAARDRTLPNRIQIVSSNRHARYSPSWSFRWDSQAHRDHGLDNHTSVLLENNRRNTLERKARLEAETGKISNGVSPLDNSQMRGTHGTCSSDISLEGNLLNEELRKSSVTNPSDPSYMVTIPTTNAKTCPSTSHSPSFSSDPASDPAPSRQAHHSPSYQLSRQTSDSQVPALRSPNDTSASEGKQSFVLSVCSSDIRMGSHSGSSDGWSMRTFSELVAPHRSRWSFDSENTSSGHGNITTSNCKLLTSTDFQSCGLCSKLLAEKSFFSIQKIIANNELPVVAVLTCGHVYHAECLENVTPDTNKFDPYCPVCAMGEKSAFQVPRKALKAESESRTRNKISRIGVVNGDLDGDSLSQRRKTEGKSGPRLGTSLSMRSSSFGRSFLRRHFSIGGSKPSRSSVSENEPGGVSSRRKGLLWAGNRKE